MADKNVLEKLTKEQLIDLVDYMNRRINYLVQHSIDTTAGYTHNSNDAEYYYKALDSNDFTVPDVIQESYGLSKEQWSGICHQFDAATNIIKRINELNNEVQSDIDDQIKWYLSHSEVQGVK